MRKFLKQKNKALPESLRETSQAGFTLIETLVAISIFTLSILALLAVLTQGISNTGYAKKKLIASYLAQEGVEHMRNMRDTYVLYTGTSQAGWDAFKAKLSNNSCTNLPDGCYFNADNLNYSDPTQPMIDITLTACSATMCPNGALSYNSATGKYGFSGVSSGYSRKITASTVSANETKVFSTVYWTQGSGNYNMVFSESLFNWVE